MNVLLALEGVLRSATGIPIPAGIAMYRALCQAHRVVLCLDAPLAQAERWLLLEGLSAHDHAIDDSVSWPGMDLRERQIDVQRALGAVDLLVDPHPDRCAKGLQKGVTSLLFLHPQYLRPEFQPGRRRGVRTWSSIEQEIEQQARIQADARLSLADDEEVSTIVDTTA